jgi:hypothetical protein
MRFRTAVVWIELGGLALTVLGECARSVVEGPTWRR